MKRIISLILTLFMFISVVSFSFVASNAAITDVLPFSSEANMNVLLTGFAGSDKVDAITMYKMDGSGTTTIKKLIGGEHPGLSTPDYPYITQGAVVINGDYYFTATYKREFGYDFGYIYKYVVAEKKYYISDKLPIAHANDICYNADTNMIMVCCYDPHLDRVVLINADDLTYNSYITLKDQEGNTLYPYAMAYDHVYNRYYACTFEADYTGGYDYVLDENYNVIKKIVRNDGVELNANKYPHYVNQGMCVTSEYVLKAYAGLADSSTYKNHKMAVTDWSGNLIQLVNDPTSIELEDISYDKGKFHFIYHNRTKGGQISEARMAVWFNKYLPNGGEGTMEDSVHYSGTTKAISKNQFTKSGYTFNGWHLSRKSDGKHIYSKNNDATVREWYIPGEQPANYYRYYYPDEKKVSLLSGDLKDEVYLTAQWAPSSGLYIEYDPNGGDSSMEMTTFTSGSKVTLPENTITRKGYKFKGWAVRDKNTNKWLYRNSSGTSKWALTTPSGYSYFLYNPGDISAALTSSYELVCQWEELSAYDVKFDSNGGTGEMDEITVETGQDVTLPANKFTKTGYTFDGWIYNGETYEDEETVKDLAADGDIITLTAKWTPITYTIKFAPNSGTGEMVSMTVSYDEKVNLSPNAFTKELSKFMCWIAADGTTYDNAAEICNLTSTAGEEILLTAKWLMYGDLDNNGKVNVRDVSMIQMYLANKLTLTTDQIEAANVNGDSKVNVRDVSCIQMVTAKLITDFPVSK